MADSDYLTARATGTQLAHHMIIGLKIANEFKFKPVYIIMGRTDGRTDGRMEGQTDGRMEGRTTSTDGSTDGRMHDRGRPSFCPEDSGRDRPTERLVRSLL